MTPSDPHPDPNLLAAFTENALLDRQRAVVMEHLARCEQCRDVLATPMQELEPAFMAAPAAPMQAVAMPAKRWSVLRWAAIAACAIIVGSVVLLLPFEKKRVASYTAAPASAPAKENPEEAKRADEPVLLSKTAPVSDLEVERDAGRARQTGSFGLRSRGAKMAAPTRALSAEQAANDKSLQIATVPPAASAPAAKPPVVAELAPGVSGKAVGGAAGSVTVDAKSGAGNAVAVSVPASNPQEVEVTAAPAAKQQETVPARNEVASSRTASSTLAASADEISEARQKKDRTLFRAAVMREPRWTLSGEGALLRSTDDGQLWSAIPVPFNGPFRALSGKGQEVWLGGAKGTLFHSSDAGQHWTQVKPASNGLSLTDDIARIDFPDPQHGVVTTANQEIWTTSDSGRTWQKK